MSKTVIATLVVAAVAATAPATAAASSQVGQTRTAYLDDATVRVKLRAVIDPLPEPHNDFHSRPPTNGRYVGVRMTVANRGPAHLDALDLNLTMVDSAKRVARMALIIGWPCDSGNDPLWDGMPAHVVGDGCRAFTVRAGRRPARLVLTAAFGVELAEWRLR
jgi:hypothetical protein